MSFQLPPLQYSFDSLDPYIDTQTMEIHYGKHHATYVSNLNTLLEKKDEFANAPIESLLRDVSKLPEDIRQGVINNGGGHANHTLFWSILGNSESVSHEPTGELKEVLLSTFSSFENMKNQMKEIALKRFGSGWSWLVFEDSSIKLLSTPNQDSPLMNNQIPLLGIDVWEHAYYLKYQNRRADYIDAIWNVINWNTISDIFLKNKTN